MSTPSGRKRPPPHDDGLSGLAEAYRKAAPYMAASTTLIASMLVFMALGYWLDRKLGHSMPWLLLLGAAIGMTGGFIGFFRTVLSAGRKK